MRRNQPEADLQRQVVLYLTLLEKQGLLVFLAIPNGGVRSKVEAAIFQGLGVRAGAPDLLIFSRGRCLGLELKAPGKKPTDIQEEFGARLEGQGVPVWWADTYEDVVAILKELGIE